MSKWVQRCIAAVLLLTLNAGTPVTISENAGVHNNFVTAEFINAAEAAQGYMFDAVRFRGIKADDTDICGGRLKMVFIGVLALAALVFLPVLLPVIFVGAIIYWVIYGNK